MPVTADAETGLNAAKFIPREIKPTTRPPAKSIPSYFWGEDAKAETASGFPIARGYMAARNLIQDGSPGHLRNIVTAALEYLDCVYTELEDIDRRGVNGKYIVQLRLSDELDQWRTAQYIAGRTLPSKGYGLVKASEDVLQWLGAGKWAAPLVTNGALWGGGYIDLLNGAYDARTLYSNYCVDMAFYYEHSYHKVFPEFEPIIEGAMKDPYALQTPHGKERRSSAKIGLDYIRGKVLLEEKHKNVSGLRSAKMDRDTAFMIMFCESSAWGVAGEAMSRGWDKGGVAHDFAFSAPGTDVVDVGSDYYNSELFNSFLNTADITDDGIITVNKLRRVYDAFAGTCARMFTERWDEPGSRLCAVLYPWHIMNSRHWFLRRALLGFSLKRESKGEQLEGDWDEVFTPDFHTTGFSRPLAKACNGVDICDQVQGLLDNSPDRQLLYRFWHVMSTAVIEYVSASVVIPEREEEIAEDMRILAGKIYSLGLIDNLCWLMAHANQHAWQVNYLFEAAMFGSLLDNEGLRGKLDRKAY